MNSRFRMKYSTAPSNDMDFWGLDRSILKWSMSHVAHHHINLISNLCDLDSAFNLHWSAVSQAMSAAACFMISGKYASSHPPIEMMQLTFFFTFPSFIYFAAHIRLKYSVPLMAVFSPPSLFSLCGADEGLLWTVGQLGGPSAHFAGIWHMWTVHH